MSNTTPKVSGITIDGTNANWEINSDGPILGSYKGQFTFKCFLTPLQRIAADREHRELLGVHPAAADADISYLTWCLAQLKQRIAKSPPFWQTDLFPGNIPDREIILEICDAAIQSEVMYNNSIKQRKLDALEKAKKAVEKMMANENGELDDGDFEDEE